MSFSRYQVPIAIVCEITGIRKDQLIKDFSGLIGEDTTSLPLDALPQDVQDEYVSDYLLHDTLIDLDVFALSGFQNAMSGTRFPIVG